MQEISGSFSGTIDGHLNGTIVGTYNEMISGSILTNYETDLKIFTNDGEPIIINIKVNI